MGKVKLLWKNENTEADISVSYGTLAAGSERVCGGVAEIELAQSNVKIGPFATIIHVAAGDNSFSFFLRDVSAESPIYLPVCGAIVTSADDPRDYGQIVADIVGRGNKSKKERVDADAEYDFDRAAAETVKMPGPIWLGVSKDMRFFQVNMRTSEGGNPDQMYDVIAPRFLNVANREKDCPELLGQDYVLYMMTGRGIGCRHTLAKSLEEGYMPILKVEDVDDGIVYHNTYFATLEKSPLDTAHLRGTDMYVADACSAAYMQTPEQQKHTDSLMDEEFCREEETVLYIRIVAQNTARVPVYAFVKMPGSNVVHHEKSYCESVDPQTGYLSLAGSGNVCVIGTVNGAPIPDKETAILIPVGGKVVYEFKVPHMPIAKERADALAKISFEEKLAEAKLFWKNELKDAAVISLPEKRIEEMIKAGMLHLDVGYYGKNPDGPVMPSVGIYPGLGTESSPGIQFLDAVGLHGLAARALQYFIEKQHDDGFIQNFNGYMSETGSALWSIGEHWRMTRDEAWARSVRPAVIKAADYLVHWREDNLRDELKGGKGYGMIAGKVADPEDPFHSFMLNAGAYAGLKGAGEVLRCCDPENAERYTQIAAQMRENIRESFFRNMAISPVIPAADGTWLRTCAQWADASGPLCLMADGGTVFSHGTFSCRDFIGANYLILQGIIDPEEPVGAEILTYFTEFLTLNNTCFSQPYYSPHPYGQLLRGDVKLFLQEFYCGLASMADRGTYTFWEHYFQCTIHKLHEESWFLMRCRWMLAVEEYEKGTLRLMAGVPRAWLEDGKRISAEHLKTYYGDLRFTAESEVKRGVIRITAQLSGTGFPRPETIVVRVPHPDGRKAKSVTAGIYDPETETVTVKGDTGTLQLEITF